jgi:hypothetical protein
MRLADEWLRFYVNNEDAYFGAKGELERLAAEDPFSALEVIEELAAKAPNDQVLGVIGAGLSAQAQSNVYSRIRT